ncbi:MAG: glutamine synthetase family protein [archaeon GBS-70-058]|nr:glutamine synthetase family protein [Candidatus Culexarchaeum nevadense]
MNEIEYLKPIIIDLDGKPRGLILKTSTNKQKIICFDGSSIKGHAPIEESDLLAKPDIKTMKTLKTGARIMKIAICDIEKASGEPYTKNTRMSLKEYVKELELKGLKFKVGVEIEYFIIRRVKGVEPIDRDQYFEIAPYAKAEKIQLEIMDKLNRIGIEVEKTHHEAAEGQYEYAIKASDPISTADNIIIAKMVTKEIAKRYGLEVTYMPKPFKNMNGSGMHIHISLQDIDGRNLFYDRDEGNISQKALQAIAGILKSSREISILVAPTVNSYKRLKPGYEAPNKICWGYGNRSTLIRVPMTIDEENCRIEYRHPDPSSNPYLAIIAVIAAAIRGINEELTPMEPCKENAYKTQGKYENLPSNLGEAIEEFKKSEYMKKILIRELHEEIVKNKTMEWMDYQNYISKNKVDDNEITEWEIERYLVKA